MKTTKTLLLVAGFYLMAFNGGGCEEGRSTAETKQTKQTNKILDEMNRQMGLPNIVNFQQKKLMKMVYELSDQENLICYAYLKADYSGKLIFIGKCIGFGVPFSAQYTNPMKYFDDPNGSWDAGSVVTPQADPNGLYMPTSSSATWLLMIDPKTKESRPVYIEPEIVVSPFKLSNN